MFEQKKEYIYPKIWNEEDICRFKIYFKTSKDMYNLPDDIIELCVERQINEEKGLLKPIDRSQIRDIKIETPQFEVFNTETIEA